MNSDLKKCNRCDSDKKKSEFYLLAHGKRLMSICKDCQKKYVKERYFKDPSVHLRIASKWVKDNPEKRRASIVKYAPKSREKSKKYRETHKEYIRNDRLMRSYGITSEIYDKMFKDQEGRCLICKKHQIEFKRLFAVDHSHKTKKVRGLLCGLCNVALGHVKEDLLRLKNMQAYLKKHE